jgi:MFS family permease
MLGSKPSELKGRKWALLANNIFFIVGAVLACIGDIYSLFIGRFISGLGVGVSSVVPPVLLSEIASASTRGTITTLHQLLLTLGIFVVSLLGYGFVTYVNHGWQYIQAFSAIPALFSLLMHSWTPESPKWLLSQMQKKPLQSDTANPMSAVTSSNNDSSTAVFEKRHEYVQAREILLRLRAPGADVDNELQVMLAEAKSESAQSADEVSWEEVFQYKRAVIIGCGLTFFQAITGINSVIFYSTTIFELAGFSESIIGTTIVGLLNFFMTLVSTALIDKLGRLVLLLRGAYIMLGALLLLSIVLLSPIEDTAQGAIAVIAVLLFVAGFAISFGAVVWTILSEIMPTRLRMKAVSLFLALNWGSNLAISLLTLPAIDGLGGVKGDMDDDEEANAQKKGVAILYLVFAGFTAVSIVFIHMLVPETKGKSPEDLQVQHATPLLATEDKLNA